MLRPDGPADDLRQRSARCGALVRTDLARRTFDDPAVRDRRCETCTGIARRFPLEHHIDPSADLARMQHLLRGLHVAAATGDRATHAALLAELERLGLSA